jgi:hypothetical protein
MTSGQPPSGEQPGTGQPPRYGQPAGAGGALGLHLKYLTMADYVIAGGALLHLLLAILPWADVGDYFGVDIPGDSISGFRFSDLVTVSVLLFLLAAGWALLPVVTQVDPGFSRGWITTGLAAPGLLFTMVAWIRSLAYGFQIWPLLAVAVAAAITAFAVRPLLPELDRPGPA